MCFYLIFTFSNLYTLPSLFPPNNCSVYLHLIDKKSANLNEIYFFYVYLHLIFGDYNYFLLLRAKFSLKNILLLLLQEEIQKKTGYIVMRAEGVFDVDANTSIDQLSEDLNIKMPEVHQFLHTCIYIFVFLYQCSESWLTFFY